MVHIVSRKAQGRGSKPPILFVHGAWHGAWCWEEHYFGYFTKAGFDCHAVDLRGHGDSNLKKSTMRWNRIGDYVEDVAAAARKLEEPPIIVAHSMGGFVLQHYLQKYPASAAILMATVPWYGVGKVTLRIAAKHPLKFLKANLFLSLKPLIEDEAKAVDLFFSPAMDRKRALDYVGRLTDESYTAFIQMLALKPQLSKKVHCPAMLLAAEDDAIINLAEQKATAKRYEIPLEVVANGAHDLMLDTNWRDGADKINDWLATLKL